MNVDIPFDFGDTLYDISEVLENRPFAEVYEYSVRSIEIQKDQHGLIFLVEDMELRPEDFGKSIFTNKELAIARAKEHYNANKG